MVTETEYYPDSHIPSQHILTRMTTFINNSEARKIRSAKLTNIIEYHIRAKIWLEMPLKWSGSFLMIHNK